MNIHNLPEKILASMAASISPRLQPEELEPMSTDQLMTLCHKKGLPIEPWKLRSEIFVERRLELGRFFKCGVAIVAFENLHLTPNTLQKTSLEDTSFSRIGGIGSQLRGL